MARRFKNDDPSTSTFQTVGDYGSVVNASGARSPNTVMAPRDAGRPAGDTPGTGTQASRRPIEIDAVTGQRLADGVNANLDAAAQHPETDPYEMSAREMRERFEARWSNVHLKRASMADALQSASDVQYAPIPGLVDRARSGYASPHEVGMHVGMSNQNTRALHWLFGGQECC